MPTIDQQTLLTAIRANKALWTPKASWVLDIAEGDRLKLLGVSVNRTDLQAIAQSPSGMAGLPAPAGLPSAVDWRSHNGTNFVSPVKDQMSCGSCVSFCTAALVEATAAIERGIFFLDLSEADLHFCSNHGANCGGWWPTNALDEVKSRGIVDEASFPYASAFHNGVPQCTNVANRAAHAHRIASYTTLSTMTDRKRWLANVGPVSAVFHVYDDFFQTGAGVYSHVTGGSAGYHCVEVVGYSDTEGCWICKNSWRSDWGDHGFFKIAYGQCGIDETSNDTDGGSTNRFPMWGAQGISLPHVAAPPAVGDPSAYTLVNNPTGVVEQHNLFRSGDGHIHALWFNFQTGWHQEDRSTLVAGVPAAAGDPVGYAFVNNPTGLVEQHNLFRSGDGHIHALWFNFQQGWHHEDRTAMLPGVPPAVGNPFGYAFINDATGVVEQHNLFRSADGHIHALWFNFATGWHHEDRTLLLPGVPPAVGDPFGYAFVNSSTGLVEQHNLFRSADGHIHALWFNFQKGWHHEDRTAMLPGVPPSVGNPFCYAYINDPTKLVEQHNLFRTGDGHIHALWFNFSSGWHHEDRSL